MSGNNEDYRKTLLLEKYKILFDINSVQNQIVHKYDRTFLTVNTIFFGIFAYLFNNFAVTDEKSGLTYYDNGIFFLIVAIMGIFISFIWLLARQTLSHKIDLRAFQIRETENALKYDDEGIFIQGRKYLGKKKEVLLNKYNCNDEIYPKCGLFKNKCIGIILPVLFMLFYIVVIILTQNA